MGLNLKLGQKFTALGEWFLSSIPECAVFWGWAPGKGLLESNELKVWYLGGIESKNMWKNPAPPTSSLCLCFFEWSFVELQVESGNLTQLLGWAMDSLHSECTCLYISVTSTDLQRHAALAASWRWLETRWQNISLLSPLGLRGARCSEEILARLWPSWLFWDA